VLRRLPRQRECRSRVAPGRAQVARIKEILGRRRPPHRYSFTNIIIFVLLELPPLIPSTGMLRG
jgi:hypothetical protein